MNNNDVLKKLRVALQLRDEDMVKIMAYVDFRISVSEMNAFFRKEDHPNYREAGDQVLRNFLNGLIIHLRGPKEGGKVAKDNFNKELSNNTQRSERTERPAPKKSEPTLKSDFREKKSYDSSPKKSFGPDRERSFKPTKGNREFPGTQKKVVMRGRKPKGE